MSIKLHNEIHELRELIGRVKAETLALADELNDRMDRIEFRKKPGPKPRRLQEKLANDE